MKAIIVFLSFKSKEPFSLQKFYLSSTCYNSNFFPRFFMQSKLADHNLFILPGFCPCWLLCTAVYTGDPGADRTVLAWVKRIAGPDDGDMLEVTGRGAGV